MIFIKYIFFTELSLIYVGFFASFVELNERPQEESGCGGVKFLNGTNGTFQTAGFPLAYEANLDCTWVIEVEDGYKVGRFVIKFHQITVTTRRK